MTESSDQEIAVRLIVRSLAQSLGVDKAEQLIAMAVEANNIGSRTRVSTAECEDLLETISEEGGLVRVAASVAKIKLVLGTLA